MSLDYAIDILGDALAEQKAWYENWKTVSTRGASLPGKEKLLVGLEEAIKILKAVSHK